MLWDFFSSFFIHLHSLFIYIHIYYDYLKKKKNFRKNRHHYIHKLFMFVFVVVDYLSLSITRIIFIYGWMDGWLVDWGISFEIWFDSNRAIEPRSQFPLGIESNRIEKKGKNIFFFIYFAHYRIFVVVVVVSHKLQFIFLPFFHSSKFLKKKPIIQTKEYHLVKISFLFVVSIWNRNQRFIWSKLLLFEFLIWKKW